MKTQVPFFRPDIREEEIEELVRTVRSGWPYGKTISMWPKPRP